MPFRALGVLILTIGSLSVCGQESQSRPATRPSKELTAEEWNEWMQGLRAEDGADPFAAAAHHASIAGFAAARLADCGAKAVFEKKGGQSSFLQPVQFVVAGFDPKHTFIEAVGVSPPVRIEYGSGFGVRGVESLDVSGAGEMYQGDATKEKLDLDEDVKLEDMGALGRMLKSAGAEMAKFDVKNRIVLTVPVNNQKDPSAVPKFARALKARGAKATVMVEDRALAATSTPIDAIRRDRFRRPLGESPPALVVTKEAGLALAHAAALPLEVLFPRKKEEGPVFGAFKGRHDLRVSVRYRMEELDLPNVVGRIEGKDPSQVLVLSVASGRRGQAAGTLFAATRILASSEPPRRTVILAIHSRSDLEHGGQDWFLGHSPVPVGRIVAAIHLADGSEFGAEVSSLTTVHAARGCRELESVAKEVLRQHGVSDVVERAPMTSRAVDAYSKRGIPAIGFLLPVGTMEAARTSARVAADLARAIADRPERPALSAR